MSENPGKLDAGFVLEGAGALVPANIGGEEGLVPTETTALSERPEDVHALATFFRGLVENITAMSKAYPREALVTASLLAGTATMAFTASEFSAIVALVVAPIVLSSRFKLSIRLTSIDKYEGGKIELVRQNRELLKALGIVGALVVACALTQLGTLPVALIFWSSASLKAYFSGKWSYGDKVLRASELQDGDEMKPDMS